VTDLHQGVVWGTNTAQTRQDERLINRFDYDGDYGTVLNRFLMQVCACMCVVMIVRDRSELPSLLTLNLTLTLTLT